MRRELRFKNFADIRQELANLEKGPVVTTGHWTYFQILEHCRKALEGSMKGIKREMSWWKKHVMGPIGMRKTLRDGFIPTGIGSPMKGTPVERVEGDEKAAMAQLHKAMEEFEKFEGTLSEHPRFGPMSKKNWVSFHSMHLANHLGHAKLKETI
jgi:hypothetical protein